YFRGKLDDAQRYWEESGRIFASLGDEMGETLSIGNLGAVAAEQGDFDRAERLQRQALALQRRLGNAPNIALALVNLADISQHLGDYTLANDLLAEAIPMLRDLGFKGQEGISLNTLAAATFGQGDSRRAAAIVLESVRLLTEVGDRLSVAGNTDLLAKICAKIGEYETGIELTAAAAALRKQLGSAPNPVNQTEIERIEETLRQAVTEDAFQRHWQAGAGLDFDTLVRRIGVVARHIIGPRQPQPVFAEPDVPEPAHNLTNRELEVLRLLTEGRSTRDISDTLYISPRTTTTHVNNILGKLEVSSRAAAVAWAMRAGVM
ncbi:MAG: tetratricopeptide repeat protein, partial [Chloroflexia bacterium]|nr:tetratricopeptide repeat protein [Chloroflexia bacterium]